MHEIKQKNPVCYEKERRRKQAREQGETKETLSLHPPKEAKKEYQNLQEKTPRRTRKSVFQSTSTL
jgi:hypothetical protein